MRAFVIDQLEEARDAVDAVLESTAQLTCDQVRTLTRIASDLEQVMEEIESV